MRSGCLEERIERFINRKRRFIFLRSDFDEICMDYDQVGRVLKKMVAKGKLFKVGYGLYAKARKSRISGDYIPQGDIKMIGKECLRRLHIASFQTKAEIAYNSGSSTQVPTGRVIAVNKRISRKIGYNDITVTFEKIRRKTA